MRQTTVTVGVSGATEPVVLDQYLDPFQVTYVKTGSGTVEVSATDPFPKDPVSGNFVAPTFTWVTAPTGAPNGANFIGQPYRAIRLTGGTGSDSLTVIQAGVR